MLAKRISWSYIRLPTVQAMCSLTTSSGNSSNYKPPFEVKIISSRDPPPPPPPRPQRKSFGSFHSEDIEVLIRQSDEEFSVPEIHKEIHASTVEDFLRQCPSLKYGEEAGQVLYHLDPSWSFLNHGAFGGVVKPLMKQAFLWRVYCESQPLRFFDRDLFPLLAHNLRSMAKYFNCPVQELLPLPNVTSGLNAVFQSVDIEPNDEIIYLSLTYGSTKKMLKDLATRKNAKLRVVELPLPVKSKETVIEEVRKVLNEKSKLIVLDQITSNTAMELPIIELSEVCKSASPNIKVVVDAAHVLFSQPVSIYSRSPSTKSISDHVDFWMTNGHKWLSASKGVAFMWVSPKVQGQLRPAVISHGFQADYGANLSHKSHFPAQGKLLSAFSWDGCRDYASLLTSSSALSFWDGMSSKFPNPSKENDGWNGYRAYIRLLLDEVEGMMKEEWSLTEDDFASTYDMRKNVAMRLIPLPRKLGDVDCRKATDVDAFGLQETLHKDYRIEVPVKCLEGKLYLRISAHIYNTPEQYQILTQVIKSMI